MWQSAGLINQPMKTAMNLIQAQNELDPDRKAKQSLWVTRFN